jgi:uncharacterized protein YndB with AHSA1/START domain
MPATADAILEDHEGRTVLRFDRRLGHPPERVWAALTEVDDLRHWHPSPFELDRRAGGAVHFLPPEGNAFGQRRVIAYEPPRLLAYSWGEDELRWELAPREDGTLLTLTHTFEDRFKAARDAAGWELCLTALGHVLSGARGPAPSAERAILGDWEELNRVLRIGDRLVRCIDSPIEHGFTFTPAVSLAVRGVSAQAVDRAFARLADGGNVLMALDRYPFSERFGWVTDRFGVSWQLSLH